MCLRLDSEEDDLIVLCDGCNVAVHQKCYGGNLIRKNLDDGDWYCDRCEYLRENTILHATDVTCMVCPDTKGVIK